MKRPESAEPESEDDADLFRLEGDFWTVTFRGITLRGRDTKGMHYLSHLLRHPDVRFDVGELATTVGPRSAARQGNTGPLAPRRERDRSAVAKRIRATIAHLQTHHPALGRHLTATIRTGYECSYQTDPDRPVRWEQGPPC